MDVRLKTRLTGCPVFKHYMNMIQIGTTPCFTFDLFKQIFDFEDITQLKFIFKQGDTLLDFDMYPESSEGDDRFVYNKTLDTIVFTMKVEDTLYFKPTYKYGLVDFEIVVIIGDKQLVFADEDSKIYVLDSLYKHVIEV